MPEKGRVGNKPEWGVLGEQERQRNHESQEAELGKEGRKSGMLSKTVINM